MSIQTDVKAMIADIKARKTALGYPLNRLTALAHVIIDMEAELFPDRAPQASQPDAIASLVEVLFKEGGGSSVVFWGEPDWQSVCNDYLHRMKASVAVESVTETLLFAEAPPFAADDRSEFEKAWKDRPWLVVNESDKDTAWRWWQAARAAPPPQSAASTVDAWQDISTAPKDRSSILLYEDEAEGLGPFIGYWTGSQWAPLTGSNWPTMPTHWMQLPTAPVARNQGQGGGQRS